MYINKRESTTQCVVHDELSDHENKQPSAVTQLRIRDERWVVIQLRVRDEWYAESKLML